LHLQVIPKDIDWVIKRAAQRGYDTPAAFMSSKPRAGINHKEYGVTSEGVNVYLDVALRHVLKIDPKQEPFTVKITGGPDGDVAGNGLKILYREYGDNAKVVGIADGSGCAEDPNGLDWNELLRLVDNNLPIDNFDPSKLGGSGVMHKVDTEEGVKARNSMHNRVKADAFIPAGGRPNTINVTNYMHFLNSDGTPSAPLIVEGANLFVTDEARQLLFDEAGVIIVKDSSANKAGVITSSYEICAAMLLSEEEFFQNKPQIVNEVKAKLHEYARMEAELLFREFENYGGSLPHLSKVVSKSVNAVKDALTDALETMSAEEKEKMLPLFRAHLPKTIADMSFDKVHERVPEQYITNAVSSCLASKLVYKEGTKFVEALPKNRLATVALRYLEAEREVALLKDALIDSEMPEKEKESILKLLDAGGARTALRVF
jgi:glutamate dehydrogenase